MRAQCSHAALRRIAAATTATLTAFGLSLVVPGSPATAAAPPGPFDAGAHGDVVRLDAALLGGSLAGVSVGHAQTTARTTAAPRVESTSANVELALGGVDLPVDRQRTTAPPSSDPPARTLLPVPLTPVATAGVVSGDTAAAYVDDTTCVPAVGGERRLGSADTRLAGLTVLGVPGLGQHRGRGGLVDLDEHVLGRRRRRRRPRGQPHPHRRRRRRRCSAAPCACRSPHRRS